MIDKERLRKKTFIEHKKIKHRHYTKKKLDKFESDSHTDGSVQLKFLDFCKKYKFENIHEKIWSPIQL